MSESKRDEFIHSLEELHNCDEKYLQSAIEVLKLESQRRAGPCWSEIYWPQYLPIGLQQNLHDIQNAITLKRLISSWIDVYEHDTVANLLMSYKDLRKTAKKETSQVRVNKRRAR